MSLSASCLSVFTKLLNGFLFNLCGFGTSYIQHKPCFNHEEMSFLFVLPNCLYNSASDYNTCPSLLKFNTKVSLTKVYTHPDQFYSF